MEKEATFARIVAVLSPYLGATMAEASIRAHGLKLGIEGGTMSAEQLEALLALLGGVLPGVFLVVGVPFLGPVVAQPGPALERFLTAAYPAFDFVLLVPILILVRITAPFRGGQVFRAWSLVLFGIVALCAADILYARLLGA